MTDRLSSRLIAWRVPQHIADRRRAKLRKTSKDKGRQPSEASLAACDWELLVTNLDEKQLSFKEAIVLYRARWQIELLFKRWKSYCQIDLLDGHNDIVKLTRLWARLCGAVIQHWLIVATGWSPALQVSFAKVAKLIPHIISELASNINNIDRLKAVIEKLQRQAKIGCKQNKRKKKPGTFELLGDPDLLEYTFGGTK